MDRPPLEGSIFVGTLITITRLIYFLYLAMMPARDYTKAGPTKTGSGPVITTMEDIGNNNFRGSGHRMDGRPVSGHGERNASLKALTVLIPLQIGS